MMMAMWRRHDRDDGCGGHSLAVNALAMADDARRDGGAFASPRPDVGCGMTEAQTAPGRSDCAPTLHGDHWSPPPSTPFALQHHRCAAAAAADERPPPSG
jgi:hypothetical protein